MLSSHLALPREGHLKQLHHVFAYLRQHHNVELVFDPSDEFKEKDWASTALGHI